MRATAAEMPSRLEATRTPPRALHTVLWSEKPIVSAAPKIEMPSRVRHSKPPSPPPAVLARRDEGQARAEPHRVDGRIARALEAGRAEGHAGEQQMLRSQPVPVSSFLQNTGDLQGADARRIQRKPLKWRRKRRERRTGE
jgi:hypothetical protein